MSEKGVNIDCNCCSQNHNLNEMRKWLGRKVKSIIKNIREVIIEFLNHKKNYLGAVISSLGNKMKIKLRNDLEYLMYGIPNVWKIIKIF